MDCVEPGQVAGRETERSGRDVVGEVGGVGCAWDDQHVRSAVQGPCQADLRRGGLVLAGDREDLLGSGATRTSLAPGSGDGEERDERHALLAAGAQELVLPGAVAEAVRVLHAYHRRDLLGLGQVLRAGVGYPEVADQADIAQLGQRAEVPGDRVQPGQAQVYQVQVIAAELAQVLLDLPAQLGGGGLVQPLAGRVPARADLGGDDQVVGVGDSAVLISSLAERSEEK